MRRVFVRFLEEIEVTKKTFRNYLTFKNSTTRFAKAVAHHAMGQGADTTVQKEFGRFQIMVFPQNCEFPSKR